MMVPENYQQQNIHDPLSNPKFGVEGSSALTGATRVPQRIGQTSITSGMPNSVEAGAGLFRLPGGKCCRCGGCQWCMENPIGVVGSHDAITRSTSSDCKYRGSVDSRQ